MYKRYMIDGSLHSFKVICEDPQRNGDIYYLAVDTTTKEEVWLYPDGIIEYCDKTHTTIYAREVSETEMQQLWCVRAHNHYFRR